MDVMNGLSSKLGFMAKGHTKSKYIWEERAKVRQFENLRSKSQADTCNWRLQHCLPEGNVVDLGGSVGVVLLVPGLKSFT